MGRVSGTFQEWLCALASFVCARQGVRETACKTALFGMKVFVCVAVFVVCVSVCVCGCVWVCVCVVGVYGFFVIEVCASFFLLSITSSKNPYRRPFSEFQSHFLDGGLDGGLDDGVGGGDQKVAGGGGRRRRECGDGRRSSSENPHRMADQSKGLESFINVVETL